ncbi:MAG: PIN domain-containing protein [Chloroflexi bacterium]|nr:PIN domain-containing protein [Chloroflexota bacterium]
MKIVLDTNVFVAAGFNPRSHAAAIVRAVEDGDFTFVWNGPTRAETRQILEKIPPLSWERFEHLFQPENEYTGEVHPDHFGQVPDVGDRRFAALADTAGAVLVSNDDHLLSVRDQLEITVLTTGEFLAEYG